MDRRIRTLINGFGDRHVTITPYPCLLIQYVKDQFVPPVRIELTTPWLKATYSSQLSYEGVYVPSCFRGTSYVFVLFVSCCRLLW